MHSMIPGEVPPESSAAVSVARASAVSTALFVDGLLGAVMLLVATGATAVTFDVIGMSGADPAGMRPGETLVIDVRVSADGDAVYGLGASVHGYDEAVIDYVDASGEAVSEIFHALCAPPPTGCMIGVPNRIDAPLAESAIGNQGNRVWLFTGSTLSANPASPDDPGLDGVIGGGGAQFRVTFEAVAPGTAQILIGTGYAGDGVVLESGQVSQAVGEVIDVVVLDTEAPGVPLLQSHILFVILPGLLLAAGAASLRGRRSSAQG